MKLLKFVLPVFAVMSLSLFSCTKTKNTQAMIYKDCSGSYIRMGAKDYRVCNFKTIAGYKTGDVVNVSFRKVKDCESRDWEPIICELHHPYESNIYLTEVR